MLHKIINRILKASCLRLSGDLILGQIDPGDGPERPEQFLKIRLPRVLRQVGHTNSG